jgi:DNA mismatch repair protein MutS
MMRQYLAIKAQHPDAILFYRMGDFYEMFLQDAERAAPLLDIALTTRDRGKPEAIPMCGVPVHGAEAYVRRLTELGFRVAVCEQVEDPRATRGRRLVRRQVVEVLTPGLVGDPAELEAAREVVVAAIAFGGEGECGLAALEASTGDFRATAVAASAAGQAKLPPSLLEELRRIAPAEVLVARPDLEPASGPLRSLLPAGALTPVDAESFEPARAPARPDGFEPQAEDAAIRAAAAILSYLASSQPFVLPHAARLRRYRLSDSMVLDAATRKHLELFENNEDGSKRGTLIERLDASVTPLGARRLRRWVAYPLLDPQAIGERQQAVGYLAERDRLRTRLRHALREVHDLERLLAKAVRPGATPRDLGLLRGSLAALPPVSDALCGGDEEWIAETERARPGSLPAPQPTPEAQRLLEEALVDDPPAVPRGSRGAGETGYIRAGFRAELDALRESARKGREWIVGLEERERERTGIASLKVRFHPVHGYALEVTKANLGRIPGDYERRQTLANAERFTTPELRDMEQRVLGARERAAALEREIFESVRRAVLEHSARIRAAAEAVADLDALASLSEVARRDRWVRPVVNPGERLEIRGGRHPVIEPLLAAGGGEEFVPNDAELDPEQTQILLLTGPNMSGKSTYLRQVALIALLAQIGSYVPADQASIGVVDRIFTRVGASDRLTRGESTFMVEMRETADILAQASRRSLVILDEIGRGTSTFDGLSIAWAVAEYLHETPGLGCRTLFATHYHELTDLAHSLGRVRNAHFEVREWSGEVIFLRKLVSGGASRSYGIQVARLAGLPEPVIARAKEVLRRLEEGELESDGRPRLASHAPCPSSEPQLTLFAEAQGELPHEHAEVLAQLRRLDPNGVTPMEALSMLQEWVQRLREGMPA